jgi:metal-dependent hydrolase (beta-lactamase superfamily II)
MKTNLHLKVITSSPEGFWATSTLVEGEKDAVLIDAQFTLSDAHRLAAEVLESRKNLTTIYITHFHPDHYFGLTVLKEAFPRAKIVALPAVIDGMTETWEEHVKTWKPMYGDNLTDSPLIPEPLEGSKAMPGTTLTSGSRRSEPLLAATPSTTGCIPGRWKQRPLNGRTGSGRWTRSRPLIRWLL